MAQLSKEKIIEALSNLKGDGDSNIVDAGLVSEVVIANGKVYFAIDIGGNDPKSMESLRQSAEAVVGELDGVESVMATLTSERKAGEARPGSGGTPGNGAGAPQNGQNPQAGGPRSQQLEGVKHIIAVASGKGGVGKSTTSVNIAIGLKSLGLNVGILDADVYGPSMPRLLGVSGEPSQASDGGIVPHEAYGVKVMSMGFMVAEGTPVVWRGPMVMQALSRMLGGVHWAPLDVLVIDMPPGTGDVQLTIAQQIPLSGAVIVSTPQDLALIDARKGINMFAQVSVPILGVVENMSYFHCPKCGERTDIFGHGGAREEAMKIGTDFLGEVPLNMSIRETSDAGRPVVAVDSTSFEAEAFIKIAENVSKALQQQESEAKVAAPSIVIE